MSINQLLPWPVVVFVFLTTKLFFVVTVASDHPGFKAEVYDLKNQLRDYVEYFEEKVQRDYFLKKYRINIEYPKAIGIIGNVYENEQTTFNKLIKDSPNWFKVVPYNYLYDNFCRFVDLAYNLLKK